MTYTQIARSSFQFARELESREIGHGDRIIILGENSPEWIIAFYGALLRGVIVVPLDEQSSAEFTARVADQTKPKVIIADMASNHTIPTIAFDNLTKIISHHSDKDYEAKHIARDDIVEIVFTSGTTAEPKGVELTHENLLANIEPIERAVGRYIKWEFLVHPIKILNLLPLSHVFGQVMGIFMPQLFRAEVVFQNHLNPADIIETIKYERVAVLASVPRILENLRRKIERDFEDELKKTPPRSWPLRWVKYHRIHRAFGLKFLTFVTGGATLDAATEEFWADLGFAVVQGYGMTETAALISLNNPFSAKRGSLGEIIAGHDVKIGEGGEILVRGKNISPGYWNGTLSAPLVITDEDSLSVPSAVAGGDFPIQNPKSQIQNREWLHTGDIGSIDDTGRLYFKGRKKDVIVTASGLNIYPEDLEAALNRQPEIKESAVVGINGPNGPEPIAALIPRDKNNIESAVAEANKSLAPFQQIRRWVVWPEPDFPRTATQKIRKTEILSKLPKLSEPSELSKPSELSALPDLSLLDSLSRVELLSALEDRYQIDIDEQAFTESTTVGDIEKLIQNKTAARDKLTRFSYPRWPLKWPVKLFRNVFYYLVTYPVTRILCHSDVRGLEHLSNLRGPVLFASNHITRGDPALIMSVLPHRFRNRLAMAMDGEMLESFRHPMADTPFFSKPWSRLKYWLVVALFNAFPLPRLSGFRRSFSFAGEAMDRDYNVLIFPEGELTKDGHIQKFRSGVGLLAEGLESPVVPVRIDGLWELKKQGRRYYAPPGSVTITFGEPIYFDPGKSAADFASNLEQKITG